MRRSVLVSVVVGLALTLLGLVVSQRQATTELRPPGSVPNAVGSQPAVKDLESTHLEVGGGEAQSRLDPLERTIADIHEAHETLLRGTVRDSNGPVAGALIYARTWRKPPDASTSRLAEKQAEVPPLSQCTSDTVGSYRLELPSRPDPYLVDIGVRANGYVLHLTTDVLIRPEGCTLDVVLSQGERIAGVVTDQRGSPLEGVRLFATQDPRFNQSDGFTTTWLLKRDTYRLCSRESLVTESEAVTDSRGAFSFFGLLSGEYLIVSRPSNWIWSPVRANSGAVNVQIVAVEATGIRLEVRDTESQAPLPRFRAEIEIAYVDEHGNEGVTTRSGSGRDGVLEMSWISGTVAIPTGEAKVTCDASGYWTTRANVTLNESGLTRATLTMSPAPQSQVQFQVAFDDGVVAVEPLEFEWAESGGGRMAKSLVQADTPGHYQVRIPRGRWFVHVRRATDVGSMGTWRGDLDCSSENRLSGIGPMNIVLHRGATLDVTRLDSSAPNWTATLVGPGCNANVGANGPHMVATAMPPGEWKVRINVGAVVVHEQTLMLASHEIKVISVP